MIHYHGGPITPETLAYRAWKGRHAFVSWAHPEQLEFAASICQSFALDNGAFSLWKSGTTVDWDAYYTWCDRWFGHPACDWAIIPDVIEGTEDENDLLADKWPFASHRGVPVWHLNESIERFQRLATAWPRVALGSSGEYDVTHPKACVARIGEGLQTIVRSDGSLPIKLHGLRMLGPKIVEAVPLSSADSTNVARNIKLDVRWTGAYAPRTRETRVDILIERIEGHPTPATFEFDKQECIA